VSNSLELVRAMEPWKADQTLELYRWKGDYIVISTVNLAAVRDPASRAIVGIAGILGGYATDGEETMAFPADESGEVMDWGELACATGPGSRDDVIEQLTSGNAFDQEARFE
jgi:hypothetical protein